MSFPSIGWSSKFEVNTGVSFAYEEVSPYQCMVEVPDYTQAEIEFPWLNKPSKTKSYLRGLIDPGHIKFTCMYTPATYKKLFNLRDVEFAAGTTKLSWKITDPEDTGIWIVEGYLSKLSMPIETEVGMTITGEIRCTDIAAFTTPGVSMTMGDVEWAKYHGRPDEDAPKKKNLNVH